MKRILTAAALLLALAVHAARREREDRWCGALDCPTCKRNGALR